MLEIEEKDLETVLKEKTPKITSRKFPFETLFALAVFISSTVENWNGRTALKIFNCTLLFAYAVYFVVLMVIYIKSNYTYVDLFQDIEKKANGKKIHDFSLIVIKCNNKYLLRYDKRWKSYLFPYKNTNKDNDPEVIKEVLAKTYGIKDAEIKTKEDTIEKWSFSAQETKTYHHTFYFVDVPDADFKKTKYNDEKYKWFTVDQMKRNKRMKKTNSETLTFVFENF